MLQGLPSWTARRPSTSYIMNMSWIYKTLCCRQKKHDSENSRIDQNYFPLFEEKLDTYNVPLELKYLAIVESALNPSAVSSPARKVWQFMYGTGKIYGLESSSFIEDRFDPYKATIAASRHLRDLYNIYGDWFLALAAYNSGPGNVNKAIRRAGGIKDYWAIWDYLPAETRGYVPAFIAVNYIMSYYREHNIRPVEPGFLYQDIDTLRTSRLCRSSRSMRLSACRCRISSFLIRSTSLALFPLPGLFSEMSSGSRENIFPSSRAGSRRSMRTSQPATIEREQLYARVESFKTGSEVQSSEVRLFGEKYRSFMSYSRAKASVPLPGCTVPISVSLSSGITLKMPRLLQVRELLFSGDPDSGYFLPAVLSRKGRTTGTTEQ